MNIFTRLKGAFSKRGSIDDPRYWPPFTQVLTKSGQNVTAETSLQSAAVYACVRVLAETISSLPLFLYRRKSDDSKEIASSHSLFPIIHDRPNPYQTSFEFREMSMGHTLLRGNFYAGKELNGAGEVAALHPLDPTKMQVERRGDEVLYKYSGDEGPDIFSASEIFHLKGIFNDSVIGYSPISQCRDVVGLALATDEHGSRFFQNDASPSGAITAPQKLTEEQVTRLRDQWQAMQSGANRFKVAILQGGLDWKSIGLSNTDSQFLETRKFQVNEIARIFRVPPHMIADLERATFSNIEHQAIDFVVHTIRPWVVRIEQAINSQLLSEKERRKYFAEFKLDGLLRGDIASRYSAYAQGRQWGWLSVNDIRKLENLDPVENGDIFLQPLNMVEAGQPPEPVKEPVTVTESDNGGGNNADTETA